MLRQYFADKGEELIVQAGTILADTFLLAAWLLIEFLFEHFVVPRLPVETQVFSFAFLVCRILFAVATLIPVIINVRADIEIIWVRSRQRVQLARTSETA
jgi:hypothetical protein